jgi:hypothetical protein
MVGNRHKEGLFSYTQQPSIHSTYIGEFYNDWEEYFENDSL